MKIKVLSSGSKGNSTLVITDQVKILIDVGCSYQYIKKELETINLSPLDIDIVLITHTHTDHVKGLGTLLKKTGLKVTIPKDMKNEMLEFVCEEQIDYLEEENMFLNVSVKLIHTSHDTQCSTGFLIETQNCSLVYITDTGYINRKYLKMIQNKEIYIMESNHDEKMLMDGTYPYPVKQRIISDYGHLSNKAASKYLSTTVGEKTKFIILAHLSEHNNTKDLAYNETHKKLENKEFKGKILIAEEHKSLEMVEV